MALLPTFVILEKELKAGQAVPLSELIELRPGTSDYLFLYARVLVTLGAQPGSTLTINSTSPIDAGPGVYVAGALVGSTSPLYQNAFPGYTGLSAITVTSSVDTTFRGSLITANAINYNGWQIVTDDDDRQWPYDNNYGSYSSLQHIGPLFNNFDNYVNFNFLDTTEQERVSHTTDLYNALGGVDTIYLPDSTSIQSSNGPRNWDASAWFLAGDGDDFVLGGKLDDKINGGANNDTIDGGAGKDSVQYLGGSFSVKDGFTINGGVKQFGDYTFTLLGTATDSAGVAGVSVQIAGPDGTDTVRNAEVFQGPSSSAPLARIEVTVDRQGKNQGFATLSWTYNGAPQGSTPVWYDPTFRLGPGDYEVVFRTNGGRGHVLELSDYAGTSEVSNAAYVQLHGGNNTYDSLSCIVGSKENTAFGRLISKLDQLIVGQMEVTQITSFSTIDTKSSFLQQTATGSETFRFTTNEAANPAKEFIVGAPEDIYRLPIPVVVHVLGDVAQPTLRLTTSGSIVRPEREQKFSVSVDNLAKFDRDVVVHLRVMGGAYDPTNPKNGASSDYFLFRQVDEKMVLLPKTADGDFTVTIKKGTNFSDFILHANSNSNPDKNIDLQITGYEVIRTSTTGKVTRSTPTGQAMLPDDPSLGHATVTIQGTNITTNAHGGNDINLALLGDLSEALGTAQLDDVSYDGLGTVTLPGNIENVFLQGTAASSAVGNDLDNTLVGNAAANSLYAKGGNDIVQGLGGDDSLVAGSGAGDDHYDGGDGIDAIIFASTHLGVTVDLFAGTATGPEIGSDTVVGIENVVGGSGPDLFTADVNANRFVGGAGSDTVSYVDSDAGVKVDLTLGTGSLGFAAGDKFTSIENIIGSSFDDVITGSALNNVIEGGDGNDTLKGGLGIDTASYAGAGSAVTVSLATTLAQDTVGAGIDTLSGFENLLGSAFNDNLVGSSGNNALNGGLGADAMRGGLGNDIYVVDDPGDAVTELAGQGIDKVQSLISFDLGANGLNVENLALLGTNAIDGTGNALANTILGNAAANTLAGGAGDGKVDILKGGAGDDVYIIEAGDLVTELANQGTDAVRTALSYTLGANLENLELQGSANVKGTGNALDNIIIGNSGDNLINGKGGNDELTGGEGADKFLFNTALNAATNVDHITDFELGIDQIQLENAIFARLTAPGALSDAFFHVGTEAADGNDYIIYNDASGALYYDSNGSAAGGQVQFATLDPSLALTNTNFTVV